MKTDQFLTQGKAAAFLEIDTKTLKKYQNLGFFNPIELPQLVLYPIHELQDFKQNYQIRQGKKLTRNQ